MFATGVRRAAWARPVWTWLMAHAQPRRAASAPLANRRTTLDDAREVLDWLDNRGAPQSQRDALAEEVFARLER